MRSEFNDRTLTIYLDGRIDSNNAHGVEDEIQGIIDENKPDSLVINAGKLEYISSAGLRILLHFKKNYPSFTITEVSSEVYEILDMTGFTQMITVEKAYRVVDVTGCEEIGRGANGTIYRIDQDNVVKVYNNADALEEIQHEREVARLALVLGIPTAISYDVVKVGDSYGSVFELLNAKSFSKILAREPEKLDWCVREYVDMLKTIHGTEVPEGKLPDMREIAIEWVRFVQDYLPTETGSKLMSLVEALPRDNHMIHGDYHTKNLELQNDEVLLIDMDTLAVGHPILEFASIYNAFRGFFELDHDAIEAFQGFSYDTAQEFLNKVMAEYLGTEDEVKINEVLDKARILGYTRLIRRSIRRGGLEDEKCRAEIDCWKNMLMELVEKTDTLTFTMNELDVEATIDNLDTVTGFINRALEEFDCPVKTQMQIELAVEEIYVNIANYAYSPEVGRAKVRVEVSDDPLRVTITFIDHGTPYDPLAKEDPDVTLSAEERQIGGLGIFLTKQTMDDVEYEYKDGQNILTIKKKF